VNIIDSIEKYLYPDEVVAVPSGRWGYTVILCPSPHMALGL